MSNHTIGNAPGMVFLDGILTHLVFFPPWNFLWRQKKSQAAKKADKGLKSRFSHVRELILEEQSQARKKQKRKHRYGQCLNSCACDGSHYFQASLMVKVVNEKKLEKTLNHTQYMYMLQKIPLFFLRWLRQYQGIIHLVYMVQYTDF